MFKGLKERFPELEEKDLFEILCHDESKRFFEIHIDELPLSKNAQSLKAKVVFQEKIAAELKRRSRKAFRSDLAAEIIFVSSQKNSPSSSKLAKNYLDLMNKQITNKKHLIYKDDSQIKYLVVKYLEGKGDSFISARFAPFNAFLDHILFLEDIAEREGSYRLDDEFDYSDSPHPDEFYEMLDLWKGETDFKTKEYYKSRLLDMFLSVFPQHGRNLFSRIRLKEAKFLTWWSSVKVDYLIKTEGDTKIFKERINSELMKFKTDFPFISNLKEIFFQIILFVPSDQKLTLTKDLDNLFRLIEPEYLKAFNQSEPIRNFEVLLLAGDVSHTQVVIHMNSFMHRTMWNYLDILKETVSEKIENDY